MRTQTLIIVFIFFLGSSNPRQFLVETEDKAEHGTDYYDVSYDYEYNGQKGKYIDIQTNTYTYTFIVMN